MTPRQRGATFGRAYWRKPHPDVSPFQAQVYLVRRQWRGIGRKLGPVVEAFRATFVQVGQAAARAAEMFAQSAVLIGEAATANEDAWWPAQNDDAWWPDAQRVRPEDYDDPDWTLGRIDGALAGWEQRP